VLENTVWWWLGAQSAANPSPVANSLINSEFTGNWRLINPEGNGFEVDKRAIPIGCAQINQIPNREFVSTKTEFE
jgi:hypothetical protein